MDGSPSVQTLLQRRTVVELTGLASPCLLALFGATAVFSWPWTVPLWTLSGWVGLVIVLGNDRRATTGYEFIGWPGPETTDDVAMSIIAYNSVLSLGTLLGHVLWQAAESLVLAGAVSLLLPAWLLKHLHFLLFPAGSRE